MRTRVTRGGNGIAARAGDLERERDVFRGGPIFQQTEVLKHDSEPPTKLGNFVHPQRAHVVAGNADLARRRLLLGEQQLHDGGLAGAGVAGQKDEFAWFTRKETSFRASAPLG